MTTISLHSVRPPDAGKPQRDRSKDRPHTTLYLDPRVLKEIRRLAADTDQKSHDLFVEGIDLMLRKYRRPSIARCRQSLSSSSSKRP